MLLIALKNELRNTLKKTRSTREIDKTNNDEHERNSSKQALERKNGRLKNSQRCKRGRVDVSNATQPGITVCATKNTKRNLENKRRINSCIYC